MAKPDEVLAKARVGELAYTGLKTDDGVVRENVLKQLIFPRNIQTYKEMSFDSSIASATSTIRDFIQGVEWEFEEPENGLDPNYPKGFLKECADDMERTFADYISESLSILEYGFSVQEKVYKTRNNKGKFKSKYDDGLIGWAKFPSRSQDTIRKWLWSDDGRELVGVQQDLALVSGTNFNRFNQHKQKINIPRNRFMLFRYNPVRDNPEGQSPLNSCYISWMYKKQLEETEASGIAKDMGGMMLIELPPEYMAKDAPQDKKDVYNYCTNLIRNYHVNQQSGIVFPRFFDDSKNNVFGIKLIGVEGSGKQYDVGATIKRHDMKILMTFLADVLALGHDGVGSYSLSSDKTNLLSKKISSVLSYITKVFNEDVIPDTFARNGWSTKVLPKLVHSDLEKLPMEDLSKYIQRVVTSGAVEVDKSMSNFLRDQLPLKREGLGEKLDPELMPIGTSAAGEGNGTSGVGTTQSGGSSSDSNSDNKAYVPEGFVEFQAVNGKTILMMEEDYQKYKETLDAS